MSYTDDLIYTIIYFDNLNIDINLMMMLTIIIVKIFKKSMPKDND